jgi:hypothetical protein
MATSPPEIANLTRQFLVRQWGWLDTRCASATTRRPPKRRLGGTPSRSRCPEYKELVRADWDPVLRVASRRRIAR